MRDEQEARRQQFYNSKAWEQFRAAQAAAQLGIDIYEYYTTGRIIDAENYHHIQEITEAWARRLDAANVIGLSEANHRRMTEADPESGLFYNPSHEQYCIASAVADSDGTIYLKNDSAWQFALKRAESYLTDVEVTGGNAVIDGGNDFAGSVADHTVNVDLNTSKVTMNLTANAGTEVRINSCLLYTSPSPRD